MWVKEIKFSGEKCFLSSSKKYVFNLIFFLKFERLTAPTILKINHQWRGTFFFAIPTFTQIIIFFQFFGTFFLSSTSTTFLFFDKKQNFKGFYCVNFENKPSMKRNFSFCHTQIYLNITFSSFLGTSYFLLQLSRNFNFCGKKRFKSINFE